MTVQPVTTTQNLTSDRSWLASLHGTDSVDSITLDMSTFTSGIHYVSSTDTDIPYSRVLSGIPVGKIIASGLYGLYQTGATDGRQNLAGFIQSHSASEVKPSTACTMARVTSSASLKRDVMPTGGRHDARSECSFSMSPVVA
jgi:hypothetical protein